MGLIVVGYFLFNFVDLFDQEAVLQEINQKFHSNQWNHVAEVVAPLVMELQETVVVG